MNIHYGLLGVLLGLTLSSRKAAGDFSLRQTVPISGCITDAYGIYRCPGYFRCGSEHAHHHHHHHGGHYHHHWARDWHWDYYRPSMYWDYYPYLRFGNRGHRQDTGASGLPREARLDSCSEAEANLKRISEARKNSGDSTELVYAENAATERVYEECLPPWMRRAAGIEPRTQQVQEARSAL